MDSTSERPGIVDLRDLDGWGAWDPPRTPAFVAACGFEALGGSGERRQCFTVPRVVLAVLDRDALHVLRRCLAWLADAEHVVLVREPGRSAVPEDGEVAALAAREWGEALAALTGRVELFDGSIDAVAPGALRRARALADALAAHAGPGPLVAGDIELAPSPWVTHDLPRYACLPGLVAGLRLDDGHARVVAAAGTIDLAEPPAAIVLDGANRFAATAAVAAAQHLTGPGRVALGWDPVHPVAWRGNRMRFYWFLRRADGEAFLASNEHDFPCGPGKKLWGYADNDPVQVHLAPTRDFVVARFEHDVLLTGSVPVVWERAGAFDVAVFAPDPRRALLFACDEYEPEDPSAPAPFDLLDEDARQYAPVVVPGPDDSARYAVDLSYVVYRIERRSPSAPEQTNAYATRVGGPGEGFAVYDAEHRLVRRARGRLLGGWHRWATVEDEGAYHREDLATGARTRVAPVDMLVADDPADEAVARDASLEGRYDAARDIHLAARPSHAVEDVEVIAVPGTRNVLLVGAGHFRVV